MCLIAVKSYKISGTYSGLSDVEEGASAVRGYKISGTYSSDLCLLLPARGYGINGTN